MNSWRAASEQLGTLQRRVRDTQGFNGASIVAPRQQRLVQRVRDRCTAKRRHPLQLRDIADRHHAGNDRNLDPHLARAQDKIKVGVVVEEQLRYEKVGAGVNLLL